MATNPTDGPSLPHDPLTPLDPEATPTAWTVRILRDEAYANLQSVESTLGGGDHGHLGMIMPDAEYILIATNGTPYVFPAEPVVPIYAGTAANRDQQRENYRAAMKKFEEAKKLQNKIKKLIIQAVPDVYLATLRQPRGRYATTHPRDMLLHIMAQ
jgi:hypothetical protein